MAYQLHVFRGTNRTDGTNHPITEEELLSVEGVVRENKISAVNPGTGMTLSIQNPNMFSYGDARFLLENGMITVAARNENAADVIRPLAEALGAVIQGDEGEFY